MTQEMTKKRFPLHIKIFIGMGAGALLGLAACQLVRRCDVADGAVQADRVVMLRVPGHDP